MESHDSCKDLPIIVKFFFSPFSFVNSCTFDLFHSLINALRVWSFFDHTKQRCSS